MFIVAGPSGGGKSSLFSVYQVGDCDAFNVDDRAAALYGRSLGSNRPVYTDIPPSIRELARSAMRDFIEDHLESRRSFTFETTLRDVTYEQTRRATANGFLVQMAFIAGGDVEEHIARVSNRAEKGGHSAPPDSIREIYSRAMRHLVDALEQNRDGGIDLLSVYHNERAAGTPSRPQLIVHLLRGRPIAIAPTAPAWFQEATLGTPFEFAKLQTLTRAALL